MCQYICTPKEHEKKLEKIKCCPQEIDFFLASLSKDSKQRQLSDFFRDQSKKNVQDFNHRTKQTKLNTEDHDDKTAVSAN